jgi:hypothetical protein
VPEFFTSEELEILEISLDENKLLESNLKLQKYFKNNILKGKSGRYLYFIGCAKTPFVKIGISNDPNKRIQNLQTGCPYPLYILAYIHAELMDTLGKQIPILEKILHKKLEHKKQFREWYELSYQEISKIIYEIDFTLDLEPVFEEFAIESGYHQLITEVADKDNE